MSTTTPNYGLVKPQLTDAADITAMNPNWDKIDEELNDLSTDLDNHTHTASDVGALEKEKITSGFYMNPLADCNKPSALMSYLNGWDSNLLNKPFLNMNGILFTMWQYPAATGALEGIVKQVAISEQGAVFARHGNITTGEFDDWAQKYLPLDGSVAMRGNLNVEPSGTWASVSVRDGGQNLKGYMESSPDNIGSLSLWVQDDASDNNQRRGIKIFDKTVRDDIKNSLQYFDYVDGVVNIYNIFGEHNYKNYVLPLDGSVAMTGALKFGAYGQVYATEYDTNIVANGTDKSTRLYIANPDKLGNLVEALGIHTYDASNGEQWYKVYGEHNKPSGSYTGNGSATKRVIDTGGLSNVCVIYDNTSGFYGAIVCPFGAILKTDQTLVKDRGEVYFANGVLTINSAHHCLNESSREYYYYVL